MSYEIDLDPRSRARLAGALAPFIAASQKVTARGRRGQGTVDRPRADRAEIRA